MASSSQKKRRNDCVGKNSKLLSRTMGAMDSLRKQGSYCDVVLVVKGKCFPAHKVVLAATSQFFNIMFTSSMKESKSREVELQSAEPEVIELMLEFIYTAETSVKRSNAVSLLDVANQYQIEPLKNICEEFLKGQLDATNCLGFLSLADCMDCPELKSEAQNFLQEHFTEVCKMEEFSQLSVKELKHLLHQSHLFRPTVDEIYDAAIHWLKFDITNREQYIVDVLRSVHFPLFYRKFLLKMWQAKPPTQNNSQCLNMIISGMCYYYLQSSEKLKCLGESSRRPRRKKFEYIIALFGGSRPHSCYYYHPKNSSWADIRCPYNECRDATAVFCDNVVYILGGLPLNLIRHMYCYNVLKDGWFFKQGPPTPRRRFAVCATKGKIYTSGGCEVSRHLGYSATDLFECYDTRTQTWEAKSSMLMCRCNHGSVEANGLIYVCGGSVGNPVSGTVIDDCETFDPSTQQWRSLAAMKEPRKNHGLAVIDNTIYAFGGRGKKGPLNTVECYDIASDTWNAAPRMPLCGEIVKCAVVRDVVYVFVGHKGASRLGRVMEYHTNCDRWMTNYQMFHMPTSLVCAFKTCGGGNEEHRGLLGDSQEASDSVATLSSTLSSLTSTEA
ncbi:kelch-like protein 7 isoform X2 [Nerophis lumbriciformis]|uniref:kelch-like protein 7 isoform X2 n=1 Tax=Nerophis lumbriciformis TaxID=546530 RepID=UPI002ADF834B|nr:kelch-like protein 7 isoform X2 [Nerophis lumbriciformis]